MKKLVFIALETLLEMLENHDKFTLVEVLSREEFESGHIPTAINVPLENLDARSVHNIRKTDTIVVIARIMLAMLAQRLRGGFWRWVTGGFWTSRVEKDGGDTLVLNLKNKLINQIVSFNLL